MIRRATPLDTTTLLGVRNAAIRGLSASHYSPEDIEAWCAERTAESYLPAIAHKVVLVYERAGSLLAFGQVDSVAGLIEALYVLPACARQGLGMTVLRALEAAAAERGTRALELDASLNAVGFYIQAGYVLVNETDDINGPEPHEVSVRMCRTLVASTQT